MTKVLVIDNYDSFVYTINGYLQQLGAQTHVVRNDQLTLVELDSALSSGEADALLISPGPGAPADAGISEDAIRLAAKKHVPMLGVCLGHQALGEVFGATVASAPELMHGKISTVTHTDVPFFAGIPEQFEATRYHSLAIVNNTLPEELIVTAYANAAGAVQENPGSSTDDRIIMAVQHRELPLYGVQYHPESVLTQYGYLQLGNWLEIAGLQGAAERAKTLSPLIEL